MTRAADDRPTIEVAECPYGCGELHEVEDLSPFAARAISCALAPRQPMMLGGGLVLRGRIVRLARRAKP